MDKTFTIAGVSTVKDTVTYRFANCPVAARTKVLERAGHTAIQLFDLPAPMTQEAGISWLNAKGFTAVLPKSGKPAGTKAEKTEKVPAVQAPVVTPEQVQAVQEQDDAFLASQMAGAEAGAAELITETAPEAPKPNFAERMKAKKAEKAAAAAAAAAAVETPVAETVAE